MKRKPANQRKNEKDVVLNPSRNIIWNASIMVGSLKKSLPLMEDYETEAQLEILSNYLADAWEMLSFIGEAE